MLHITGLRFALMHKAAVQVAHYDRACFASLMEHMIGEVLRIRQLQCKFQSYTRRTHPLLSVIFQALQLVQMAWPHSRRASLAEVLTVCYDHPALHI